MSNLDFKRPGPARSPRQRQSGMTLLELLIGMTIGLLVIGAAIGTMLLSRQTSGTVSEISQLQQQASYALRTLGLQLRQAGSLELRQTGAGAPFTFDTFTGVAIDGTEGASGAPDTLIVGNQPSRFSTMQRNCAYDDVAGLASSPSAFAVHAASNQLTCLGVNALGIRQPLLTNVADFQVLYRVNVGTNNLPAFQLLDADAVVAGLLWNRVAAIELCIDLRGNEPIPDLASAYQNCQGNNVARGGRIHFVARNVFYVRKVNLF